MNSSNQLAKHLREVFFGGNWTWSNMTDNLKDVNWVQATTQVHSLNTIATLTFHIGYFVDAITDVLTGKPLTSKDELSFDHPSIHSEEDWQKLVATIFANAETLITLVEQLPENKLWEDFTDKKYGIYYRNLLGLIEHTHYHLGQIAVIKKIVLQGDKK